MKKKFLFYKILIVTLLTSLNSSPTLQHVLFQSAIESKYSEMTSNTIATLTTSHLSTIYTDLVISNSNYLSELNKLLSMNRKFNKYMNTTKKNYIYVLFIEFAMTTEEGKGIQIRVVTTILLQEKNKSKYPENRMSIDQIKQSIQKNKQKMSDIDIVMDVWTDDQKVVKKKRTNHLKAPIERDTESSMDQYSTDIANGTQVANKISRLMGKIQHLVTNSYKIKTAEYERALLENIDNLRKMRKQLDFNAEQLGNNIKDMQFELLRLEYNRNKELQKYSDETMEVYDNLLALQVAIEGFLEDIRRITKVETNGRSRAPVNRGAIKKHSAGSDFDTNGEESDEQSIPDKRVANRKSKKERDASSVLNNGNGINMNATSSPVFSQSSPKRIRDIKERTVQEDISSPIFLQSSPKRIRDIGERTVQQDISETDTSDGYDVTGSESDSELSHFRGASIRLSNSNVNTHQVRFAFQNLDDNLGELPTMRRNIPNTTGGDVPNIENPKKKGKRDVSIHLNHDSNPFD